VCVCVCVQQKWDVWWDSTQLQQHIIGPRAAAACDVTTEGQVNTNEVREKGWNAIMIPSS